MKKLLYTTALILMCQGCQQKSPTDNSTNTTEETSNPTEVPADSVAAVHQTNDSAEADTIEQTEWLKKKSIENPDYIMLATPILAHTESAANLEEELKWYKTVQSKLVAGYNYKFSNDKLSNTEKEVFMARELEHFLDNDNAATTIDMIENANIKTAFLRFKLAYAYNKLLQQSKAYNAEIENWMEVEKHMTAVIVNDNSLNYFGGTMAGIACLTNKNRLLEARLNDVNTLIESNNQKKEREASELELPEEDAL